MQSLITLLSGISLSDTPYTQLIDDKEPQSPYIVNEHVSWHVCRFLRPIDLFSISLCNKSLRAVALANDLWLPFVDRSEPQLTPNTPLYKRYLFQQQTEKNLHTRRYKELHRLCTFQANQERPNPGKNCLQSIFFDSRLIYRLKANGELSLFSLGHHQRVNTLKIQELKTSRRKRMPHAICSVRNGKHLIVRSEVPQATATRLSCYNLETTEKSWQGQEDEVYLNSGGLNLGIGWLTDNEIIPWNRTLTLRRHSSYDETRSTQFATIQKVGNQYKLCQYDITRQAALFQLPFPEDTKPIYCDLSASGNLSVITTCRNERHYEHTLTRAGQVDQEVEVLAFMPSSEEMIVRSKRPEDRATPVFYIDRSGQRRALQLPLSSKYYAQLRQNKACVLVSVNSKRSLYLINLKDPLLTPQPVDLSAIKPFDLYNVTMFDDFIVACCFDSQNLERHKTVLIDAVNGKLVRELCPTAIKILGREGNILIIDVIGTIYSIDLQNSKTTFIKKVQDTSAFYKAHTLFFVAEFYQEYDHYALHCLTFNPKVPPQC